MPLLHLTALFLLAAAPATQDPGAWRITGRILDAVGAPVAGAQVRAGCDPREVVGYRFYDPAAREGAVTNASGRFAIDHRPSPDPFSGDDLFCLLPGRNLVLAEIPQRAERSVAFADGQGRLSFSVCGEAEELRLRLGDWVYRKPFGRGRGGAPVVLPDMEDVEYRVVDEQGRPAAGLTCAFDFTAKGILDELEGALIVGEDGSLHLPAFGHSALEADAEEYLSSQRFRWDPALPWSGRHAWVDPKARQITVARPRTIEVLVLDPEGEPVEAVDFGWVYDAMNGIQIPPAHTYGAAPAEALGGGRFRVTGILDNTLKIVAEASGSGRGWCGLADGSTISLPRESAIGVQVLGPDGAPLAGAAVTPSCHGDLELCFGRLCTSLLGRIHSPTDAEGRTLNETCPQHQGGSLFIDHPQIEWREEWEPADTERILAAPAFGSVSGLVIAAAGEDLSLGQITVTQAWGSSPRFVARTARPARDGSFRVDQIPAGRVELSYLLDDAGPPEAPWIQGLMKLETAVDPGGQTEVSLDRRGGGEPRLVVLRGRAKRRDVAAAEWVELQPPDLSPALNGVFWTYRARLAEDGSFAALVLPGAVELEPVDPERVWWQPTTTVSVQEDLTEPIEIDLDGRFLDIAARSPDGEPLSWIWLTLYAHGVEYVDFGQTDERGNSRLEAPRVFPADLRLHASESEFPPPARPEMDIPLSADAFGADNRIELTIDLR